VAEFLGFRKGKAMAENKQVILSGMRSTGKLHLGHLEGALKNYLKFQESGAQCFFMIADWHALTSEYAQPAPIRGFVHELLLDWLAVGLDPKRACVFVQSDVPEHAELFLMLAMLTPLAWAERCPTYKEQQQELTEKDLSTYGFLGYPILQAADILLYRATHVPVGADQLPHVEMTREIARRLNHFYGEVLPEPESVLTPASRLPGTDGRKMSKSYGNAILLSDEDAEIQRKIMQMYTDPEKVRANTPGKPDRCVVLAFFKIYQPEAAEAVERECRAGERGCVACKKQLLPVVLSVIAPIRARREQLAAAPDQLEALLRQGADRARARARETLQAVRQAMQWRPLPSETARP
jgi:tryptophanyl-tRNA synthetase